MRRAPAFIISTSRRLPGARLSLVGEWGNLPHDSVESAAAEAHRLGGVGVKIILEQSR